VRSWDEVPIDEADVKPAELTLARQLIDQSSTEEFDPKKYTDEVREQMLKLIEGKVAGQEITVQAAVEDVAPKVIDLMAALKASLEEKERMPAGRAGKRESAAEEKKGKSAEEKAAPKAATKRKKAAGG
jgi:DNA end-binding protein Ku